MDPFSANITLSGPGTNALVIDGTNVQGVGMIKINASSVSAINNLTLTNGDNSGVGGGSGHGGAIEDLGSLTLSGVMIENCTADSGGGIYVGGWLGMSESTVRNNWTHAKGFGGGIYMPIGSQAQIYGSQISDNYSDARGGGIVIMDQAQVTLQDTNLSGNVANVNGGGIYVSGGTLTMIGGALLNNSANVDGGAIYHAGGSTTLTNVNVDGNSAVNQGGGVYIGSNDFSMSGGSIQNNTALDGGGIAQSGATASFTGVAVANNYAENWGGGVYIEGGVLTFTTCSFAGNGAAAGGLKIARTTPPNKPTPVINIAPDCTGVTADDIVDFPYGQQ